MKQSLIFGNKKSNQNNSNNKFNKFRALFIVIFVALCVGIPVYFLIIKKKSVSEPESIEENSDSDE